MNKEQQGASRPAVKKPLSQRVANLFLLATSVRALYPYLSMGPLRNERTANNPWWQGALLALSILLIHGVFARTLTYLEPGRQLNARQKLRLGMSAIVLAVLYLRGTGYNAFWFHNAACCSMALAWLPSTVLTVGAVIVSVAAQREAASNHAQAVAPHGVSLRDLFLSYSDKAVWMRVASVFFVLLLDTLPEPYFLLTLTRAISPNLVAGVEYDVGPVGWRIKACMAVLGLAISVLLLYKALDAAESVGSLRLQWTSTRPLARVFSTLRLLATLLVCVLSLGLAGLPLWRGMLLNAVSVQQMFGMPMPDARWAMVLFTAAIVVAMLTAKGRHERAFARLRATRPNLAHLNGVG